MKFLSFLFLITLASSCHSQNDQTSLSPKLFNDKFISTSNAILLDVRTPGEFQNGFIQKAINIDYNNDQFETEIAKLDKKKNYFVYCLSGGRSGSAADNMRKQGFEHVYELKGGVMAWEKAGLVLTKANVAVENKDKISAEEYSQLIASDKVVLVDFYAPWCGPCKQMMPILEELTETYKGKATVIRINVDENKSLQRAQQIDEIPFFKLYRNGQEAGNFIGQLDRASFVRILDGK